MTRETIEKICPVDGQLFVDRSSCHTKMTCSKRCRNRYAQMRDEAGTMQTIHGYRRLDYRWRTLKRKGCIPSPKAKAEIEHLIAVGVCECCGRQIDFRHLFIDHDHRRHKVRGALCHRCNAFIGGLDNSMVSIDAVHLYLARTAVRQVDWETE